MTFYCCHAYLISCFLFVSFVFWKKWASIEQKRAHCQTVCSHKSCGPLSFLYLGREMSHSEFLWRGVLCCSVYLFSACCCLCCSSPPHVHTMMCSCLIWYCWGLSVLSSHGMCPLTSVHNWYLLCYNALGSKGGVLPQNNVFMCIKTLKFLKMWENCQKKQKKRYCSFEKAHPSTVLNLSLSYQCITYNSSAEWVMLQSSLFRHADVSVLEYSPTCVKAS